MTTVFIGLGSNLGARRNYLLRAVEALHCSSARVHALSKCYATQPVGRPDQPAFLNAVCRLVCELTASLLLARCQEIERGLGRSRSVRWGPREIDLDILYFGNAIIRKPGLFIPHPRIQERRFVLVPMAELCPDWLDPLQHRTVSDLLQSCGDGSTVVSDMER